MKTWVKLHTKALDSPDYAGALTWAQRGIFDALILLAGRMDCRDGDEQETGQLDTPETTAWRIRCDVAAFQEALPTFIERGMVEDRDGTLYLTNYLKYAQRPPSSSRKAVRQRVQRHRNTAQAECNDVTPSLPPRVTTPDTEQNRIDTEVEVEQREHDDDSVLLRKIGIAWGMARGGLVNQMDSEQLKDLILDHGGDDVLQAIETANSSRTRGSHISLSYVRAILDRWKQEGKGKVDWKSRQADEQRKEDAERELRKVAEWEAQHG